MECEAICSDCVCGKPVPDIVPNLNTYLEMQDGGCRIERHELLNEHWKLLGYMRSVREKYRFDRATLAAEQAAAEKKAREA